MRVEVEVRTGARAALATTTLVEWVVRLGERRTRLRWRDGALRGEYVLRRLPRGRYSFAAARVEHEDPFGLDRVSIPVRPGPAVLVYPRLVELGPLFSEAGVLAHDGRRMLLRRPSGFDFHSVREYEEGESLRRVHWRATAKRGQLMVKELEDAPRDEVAVVLDADARAVVGDPPDSSFELQVRAAGSILRAHACRGRRAVLVVNSALRETQRVHSLDGDWHAALEVLAAVEPTGDAPLAALLAEEAGAAARAVDLAVVTARLAPALVDRLVQRALARRGVSVVYVDAASFGDARRVREPGLLRLQAAGVPVAVCRREDDLAAVLGAPAAVEATGA